MKNPNRTEKDMWTMGVDMGTSGCKAVVFDERWNLVYRAYREYDIIMCGDGKLEIDPELIWKNIREVIIEANANTNGKTGAFAISAIGDVIIPLNERSEVVRNSIVDFDPRGRTELNRFVQDFDTKRFYDITGMPPLYIGSLAKILWIRENEPENYQRIKRWATYEDYIIEKLGFAPTVSYSEAARTMLFDIRQKEWSKEILNAAGIDIATLPKTVRSGEIIGVLKGQAAKDLGFCDDVVVASGGHDIVCAAIGAGLDENKPECAVNISGTIECITVSMQEANTAESMLDNNLPCYPGVDSYITFGVNLTSGCVVKWYRDVLDSSEYKMCKEKGRNYFEYLRDELDPSQPSSLVFVPHFSGSGNPDFDPEDKGVIFGLTIDTTKNEIVHSMLEGLCYECKLHTEAFDNAGIELKSMIAVGGGNENDKQLQLKANICGITFYKAGVTEGSALGAASLAGLAVGVIDNPSVPARKQLIHSKAISPDPVSLEAFKAGYQRYKAMHKLAHSAAESY